LHVRCLRSAGSLARRIGFQTDGYHGGDLVAHAGAELALGLRHRLAEGLEPGQAVGREQHAPRARIELNYDAAIRSLVAAGYGAVLLPLQPTTDAALGERLQVLPIVPKLTRRLGIAHRPRALLDGATLRVLEVLAGFRQT